MRRKWLRQVLAPMCAVIFAATSTLAVSAVEAGSFSAVPVPTVTFEDVTDEVGDAAKDLVADSSFDGAEIIDGTASATLSDIAPDEETRVIIVFDEDSVVDAGFAADEIAGNDSALALTDDIIRSQEAIVDEINANAPHGATIDVHYNFTILTNAVSADARYGDLDRIRATDGVSAVIVADRHDPMTKASPNMVTAGDMVGTTTTWLSGYTGAGQRIAIIDTGIDEDHPSFDGGAFLAQLSDTAAKNERDLSFYDLLDADEINEVLPYLNAAAALPEVTADDLYRTSKIAFGFNYVDHDLDITHDNDKEGDHGTHVSGIATANTYVPDASSPSGYSVQETGVMGVAPDAQLITMKVFGRGGGAYTDDYMAAIEDAILLNADAINLSLGSSSAGLSSETDEYINSVLDKMTASSSIVTISAGNSGRWADYSTYGANLKQDVNLDTVGSPGSYTNAFTIASAVNSGFTGYPVLANDMVRAFYNDGNDCPAPEFMTLDTSSDASGTDYDFVLIDGKGLKEDYEGVDVEGKIAIVQRGEISFAEKHMIAEAAGAIGLLVYNNTSGTISMTMQGSEAVIPVASITMADGLSMIATSTPDAEKENVYYGVLRVFGKVSTDYNAAGGYTVSDFSSFGVPDSLELKPEITAPGGNIYSTVDKGGYGNMSGTSMAAPSTAGMTALVTQYIKENDLAAKTGLGIRALTQSLLMSTATPMHVGNDDSSPVISPRSQGAGLGNAADATTTPAYILVGDKEGNDGKVKIELGDDPDRNGVYSFSFDVYNLTDETQLYDIETTFLTEEILYDDYIAGEPHELNPRVSISTTNTIYVYDLNGDNTIGASDAKALLRHVNGTEVSSRILSSQDAFDFNADGVLDTLDVTLFMQEMKVKRTDKNLREALMGVKDKTTVNIKVTLSDADRAYLDNFENGMYIDGYVYLTKNGVDLSVPVMGFYGNWADSYMYEPFDYLEYHHNEDYEGQTYTGIESANNLTFSFAKDPARYYYNSNMFADDDIYMPERNAMSSVSGDSVASVNFSLIRNAGRYSVFVRDLDTGEFYLRRDGGAAYATYYYANKGEWMSTNYNLALNWKGLDASGASLPEGTRVEVGVRAVPSYYNNVPDVFDVNGSGLEFTVPMVIDNTAPEILDMRFAEEDHVLSVTTRDNNYAGAVLMLNAERNKVIGRYALNQEEKGADMTIDIVYPDELFFIQVYDYAGNFKVYRVNMSDHPDVTVPETLTMTPEYLTLLKNADGYIKATAGPVYLLDEYAGVTYESMDESIATVDADGVVHAVAVGETDIIASTVENGPDGQPLTAVCHVTVDALDLTLDAFQWDEEGQIFFSDFDVMDPESLRKISERVDQSIVSATNYKDGKIIAATEDDYSLLYVYDPADGYSAVELPEEAAATCTDLAYSEATNQLYASYAPYVLLMDGDTGEFQGAINLTDDLDGDYIASMALVSSEQMEGMDFDFLAIMTTTGSMYWVMFNWDYGYELFYLGETGISTAGMWNYNSLYYDFDTDYYFWSVFDNSNHQTLYAIKDETIGGEEVITAFPLGTFPEGVWPVGGLIGDWRGYPEGGWENYYQGAGASPLKSRSGLSLNAENAKQPVKEITISR